jgi:hypothetical protein
MSRRQDSKRGGRPCGAHRGGNVSPLTTPDRHTGRVALDASEAHESAHATGSTARAAAASSEATSPISEADAQPAGSRDEKWRTPREGSGEGRSTEASDPVSSPDEKGGPILSSYSVHNGPSRSPKNRRLHRIDSFVRREWERDVEAKTRHHRVRCAHRHRRIGEAAAAEGRTSTAAWHFGRARGQLRRFEQVRDCGGMEFLVSCESCGHEMKRIEARCGNYRICVTCRGARADQYRFRFREGRERALQRAQALLRPGVRGGRWSEKFLTFTVPHSGDVKRDIAVLPKAYRRFWKKLQEHLREDRHLSEQHMALIAYVRVLEVTAGRQHDGHAHLHLYLLSPFLPVEWLAHLWGWAVAKFGYDVPTEPLQEVIEAADDARRPQLRQWLVTRRGDNGRPLQHVFVPIVFVEQCYGDIENELVKYLIKDIDQAEDGSNKLMEAGLFGRIYEGLEDVRTIQPSPHFWLRRSAHCKCERCHGTKTRRQKVDKGAPGDSSPTIGRDHD